MMGVTTSVLDVKRWVEEQRSRVAGWKIIQLSMKRSIIRTDHYEINFCHRAGMMEFLVEECNLAEILRNITPALDGVKIVWLDIDHNPNLSTEDWHQLGVLVRQSGVKRLFAQNCHLTAECLESFTKWLNGYKLKGFDCCSSVDREKILMVCRQVYVYDCSICENVKSEHKFLDGEMQRKIDSMGQQMGLKILPTAAKVYEAQKCGYHVSFDYENQRPLCVLECLQMGYLKDTENKKYKRPRYSNEYDEAGKPVVSGGFINYFESGSYTRGHMAAAANHKYSKSTYNATFTYVNMLPLELNVDGLTNIESRIQILVQFFDNVGILTSAIYDNRNNIPKHVIKIVLCVDENRKNQVWWFFCVPNKKKENAPLSKYLVPPDKIIEEKVLFTLDIFDCLPNLDKYELDEKYKKMKFFKEAVEKMVKELQDKSGINCYVLFR